ncbi:MAG TPA: hypothetical protein VFJ50_09085 [Gemmatimonadales bacterium]|nr:hypothetical protein [Gemmatimonadales bacterium]
MIRSRRTLWAAGLAVAVVGMPACKKKEAPAPPAEAAAPAPAPAPPAFAVQGIDVGKGIGADKKVTAPATTFGRRDTIYVSVATEGAAPSKTISAKWTFQDGQVVKEQSETIAPTGPAATEFHISKPKPWPVGKYKVEIAVDGAPAGSKDFEVK